MHTIGSYYHDPGEFENILGRFIVVLLCIVLLLRLRLCCLLCSRETCLDQIRIVVFERRKRPAHVQRDVVLPQHHLLQQCIPHHPPSIHFTFRIGDRNSHVVEWIHRLLTDLFQRSDGIRLHQISATLAFAPIVTAFDDLYTISEFGKAQRDRQTRQTSAYYHNDLFLCVMLCVFITVVVIVVVVVDTFISTSHSVLLCSTTAYYS
mmetsp:Transcript_63446/g.72973  ORF Transcript_63446/g.72973 Transcript_63446/m.72973 type:complete len:206 (+) Transcript_63446:1153-1770(+)